MIKYGDLVKYIKDNHVNWNTDLFDVLRGFFEQYYPLPTTTPLVLTKGTPSQPPSFSSQVKASPLQQELFFPKEEFHEPTNGEYTSQDLMNLFST